MKRVAVTALLFLMSGCYRAPSREEVLRELEITITDFALTSEQKLARSELVQSVVDAIGDGSIQNSAAEDYAALIELADTKVVRPGEVTYLFRNVHANVQPFGEGELEFSLVLTSDEHCIRNGYLNIPFW